MKVDDIHGCPFCRISHAQSDSLPKHDVPIVETENFFVIPALGHFVEGYVLICPRTHFLNLGRMSRDLFSEYLAIKEQLCTLLSNEYGRQPVFFEHGPASYSMSGGSCVDHAHLHAIPADMSTPPYWMLESLEGGKIDDINELMDFAVAGKPYFFLECSGGAMYLFDASIIPCQYGRRVFARHLGIPEQWDWALFQFRDRMLQTSRSLRARMERCNA